MNFLSKTHKEEKYIIYFFCIISFQQNFANIINYVGVIVREAVYVLIIFTCGMIMYLLFCNREEI